MIEMKNIELFESHNFITLTPSRPISHISPTKWHLEHWLGLFARLLLHDNPLTLHPLHGDQSANLLLGELPLRLEKEFAFVREGVLIAGTCTSDADSGSQDFGLCGNQGRSL
jgi:hypothetical protein